METELLKLRPNRLLLLTGIDWAFPFLKDNRFLFSHKAFGKYVQAFGPLTVLQSGDVINTIVANHPQGKPEKVLSQEIVQAFQSMFTDTKIDAQA